MNQRQASLIERRSGEDRRNVYRLSYFNDGGRERHSGKERRSAEERRTDCFRVSNGSSVFEYTDEG